MPENLKNKSTNGKRASFEPAPKINLSKTSICGK